MPSSSCVTRAARTFRKEIRAAAVSGFRIGCSPCRCRNNKSDTARRLRPHQPHLHNVLVSKYYVNPRLNAAIRKMTKPKNDSHCSSDNKVEWSKEDRNALKTIIFEMAKINNKQCYWYADMIPKKLQILNQKYQNNDLQVIRKDIEEAGVVDIAKKGDCENYRWKTAEIVGGFLAIPFDIIAWLGGFVVGFLYCIIVKCVLLNLWRLVSCCMVKSTLRQILQLIVSSFCYTVSIGKPTGIVADLEKRVCRPILYSDQVAVKKANLDQFFKDIDMKPDYFCKETMNDMICAVKSGNIDQAKDHFLKCLLTYKEIDGKEYTVEEFENKLKPLLDVWKKKKYN